jgi:hypothetical protein
MYSGNYTTAIEFDIENTHPTYECNNFYVVDPTAEFQGNEIDLRIDQPSTTIGFENISGLFCNDGTRCEPEVLYEELFELNTENYLDSENEIISKTFILPDTFVNQECFIELIVKDAELDSDGEFGNNVGLFFKNSYHNIDDNTSYVGGGYGNFIGDLSSGIVENSLNEVT